MSLYVLDTDILTLYQDGNSSVRQRIAAHSPQDVVITVLTVEEQLSGWYTFLRKAKQIDKLALAYQSLADTARSLAAFQILSFDEPSIHRYESLRKLRLTVRKMDLRIASVVLERNATLVTRNARDFKQVPGLSFVDWSQ
jgi:tRNA(fMet)-specific endonuclease VapC